MCEAVLFYAQLVHQRLKDSGFYDDVSAFKTSDEVRKLYVECANYIKLYAGYIIIYYFI